eukprot:scaffold89981_cov63-Phaeocystis_antarctica.AAC.3
MPASERRRTSDNDTPCLQHVSPSHAAPGEHVPRLPRDSVKVMRTSVVAAVPPSAVKHMNNRTSACMGTDCLEGLERWPRLMGRHSRRRESCAASG